MNAPIGVFDSGIGGLSVLRALRHALPNEDLVYAADSAYAPYGDHDADYVVTRALRMADILVERGVKAVVVACNTATVLAIEQLRARHSFPIVAMEPAIKPGVQ
jgi:glutamate racemase